MIKILESRVIDQIAAGEVIERPAQLVKELVENAIDAQATEIEIDFSCGGRFVQIKDNGCGISKEDLPLALARHATSKISASNDLWSLTSYGFRGEALASISAVSKVSIASRLKNAEVAYSIESKFGNLASIEDSPQEQGTCVRITDLFENIPARLKFLKSDTAEHMQIKKVIKAMAMSRPDVSFRVRQNSKILFYWPSAESWLERVEDVLEKNKLFLVNHEFNGIRLKAALSSPKDTTRTSKNMWLFVQTRWIQDKSIHAALLDGYRSFLMHGEFPYAVVWIDLDPENVDVNIHPSKSQVKFLNPSDVYRCVLKATRDLMEKAPWLEGLTSSFSLRSKPQITVKEEEFIEFKSEDFQRTQYQNKSFDLNSVQDAEEPYSVDKKLELRNYAKNFSEKKDKEVSEASIEACDQVDDSFEPRRPLAVEKAFWSDLQVLGQAQLTYIIAQSDKAMVIIDQHAAHERLAYEILMKSWKNGDIEVQNYLLPETIELEEGEVEVLQVLLKDFERLGLYVEVVGPTTLVVRGAPSIIKAACLQDVLEKTAVEVLSKSSSFAFESVVREICSTMACHSVIRAGQALSIEEMKSLLEQMDEFRTSSFCPHGRPVYVEYPFFKLEKDFGRSL